MSKDRDLRKSMDTLFPQGHGHPDLPSDDECRVCTEPVVDGRWSYCSERCREIAKAVQRMFVWEEVRERVLERDDYTCQECGLSKERAWRAYHHVQARIDERAPHRGGADDFDRDAWRDHRDELTAAYGVEAPVGHFHVDHITPVSESGHKFDEANLQVLCADCHEAKTAAENRTPDDDATERPELGLDAYLDD
jgi:5-methylcytosine-specific restriction endonuclease McrA